MLCDKSHGVLWEFLVSPSEFHGVAFQNDNLRACVWYGCVSWLRVLFSYICMVTPLIPVDDVVQREFAEIALKHKCAKRSYTILYVNNHDCQHQLHLVRFAR